MTTPTPQRRQAPLLTAPPKHASPATQLKPCTGRMASTQIRIRSKTRKTIPRLVAAAKHQRLTPTLHVSARNSRAAWELPESINLHPACQCVLQPATT